jgi:hypothetical protein
MISQLRRMWYLLDTNDIHNRPRYIRSGANIWADDSLSRELNNDDIQLNPRVVANLKRTWGPHSVDRFASTGKHSYLASTRTSATPKAGLLTASMCPSTSGNERTTTATPRGARDPHSWLS